MDMDPGRFFTFLEDRAEKFGDRVALIFENGNSFKDEEITYGVLYGNTLKIAAGFKKMGYRQGEKIALLMRNHPEFIYLLGAASALGAVIVPVDPRTRGDRLTYILKDAGCKAIVATADLLPEAERAADGLDRIQDLFLNVKPDVPKELTLKYKTLQEMLSGPDSSHIKDRADEPSLPLQVIYTSGVTGPPKGVVLPGDRFSGYALIAEHVWQYKEDDILYTGLSLTHGNAQAVTLIPALALGRTAVISQRFTKSRIWDVCRKYGCTTFSLLGGMMSGIYNEPPRSDDAENPVRVVLSAGTPKAIWEDFERRFGVKILEWYGAVEGGFAYKPPGEGPIGSFGKPLPGMMEIKIVDEDDRELPPHQIGELISRMGGQDARVEYLNNPEASKDKTRKGWLRSGDMCYRDGEGWLFFAYRKGKSLRRSGEFIQPDSVEKIIGEHPEVSEVCVYGISAASGAPGESDLVAAVANFTGRKLDPAEIFALCVEKLERNTVPSYIQLVEEIPKSISEKHLDSVLRENFDPGAGNVYSFEDYK